MLLWKQTSNCIHSRLFRKHAIWVALSNKKITRLLYGRASIETTCSFNPFFWNYTQGISLPEGKRWWSHPMKFASNLLTFFNPDVKIGWNYIHSLSPAVTACLCLLLRGFPQRKCHLVLLFRKHLTVGVSVKGSSGVSAPGGSVAFFMRWLWKFHVKGQSRVGPCGVLILWGQLGMYRPSTATLPRLLHLTAFLIHHCLRWVPILQPCICVDMYNTYVLIYLYICMCDL